MIRLTKSQPVALLGEAPPRVLVEPAGSRQNSWEDVADLSFKAGIALDPWQETILRAAMGERADRTWAAKRVGVSVARQNGKSQLLVARALAGVLLFGEKKIVISAHQADTARETFSKLVEILEADGNEWLMDRVKSIMNAINRESVKFKNGATIQFKARTGSGGRGFSSDCLLLDEAQRVKRAAWVSINSTMSAMPNPQVWLLGTPPTQEDYDADMGDVFESIRDAARAGTSTGAAWCEWGANPDADEFAQVMAAQPRAWSADVEAVCWSANPAWNARINLDVVQGEFESYSPVEFAQDRCGVWLSDIGVGGSRAVSAEQWDVLAVDDAPEGVSAYAVSFNLRGDRLALAGARKHDGGVHVEIIDAHEDERGVEYGLGKLADWFCQRMDDGKPRWRRSSGVALSGRAGAPALAQLLRDRGVPDRWIVLPSTVKYVEACSMWLEGVRGETVTHKREGQAALDASVAVTDLDKRGGLVATIPDGDETPVEAVALAHWVARTSRLSARVTGERKAVFL